MAKAEQYVVGIDIGSSKVAVLIGQRDQKGALEVAGRGTAPNRGTRRGNIVNIADLSALHPWPSYLTHTISKSGLVAMTEALALALAPSIRVNAVAPGMIVKPEEWSGEHWTKMIAALPLQRAGTVEDVAGAVLYCARSDSMTGQTIVLDGGRSLV